jgi:hypothetical protein
MKARLISGDTLPVLANRSAVVALLVLCVSALSVRAGDVMPEPDDIPNVVPPLFSGASGIFTVSARAEPTTVQAEQPVTFTLHIEARQDGGPVRKPPQRLDLNEFPDFADNFFIQDPRLDRQLPDGQGWEFVYRLKPRRADVSEIPSVPFVYWDPAFKGFQRPRTDPIPLQVTEPPPVEPGPREVSPIFLQTYTGPALFTLWKPWALPDLPVLVVMLLAPPLFCGGLYVVWRQLNPDAARLVKQRRSRAATFALKQLERLPHGATEERAAHVASAVTAYLQQRLDLHAAEPTPAEAATHLRNTGCPDALTKQTEEFFRTCDAARFFSTPAGADLPASARKLILDLEAHTWASVQS